MIDDTLKIPAIKSTHFKDVHIKDGTYNFETVRLYIYLDKILTNKNELHSEI